MEDYYEFNKQMVCFDKLLVLDLKGNILKEFNFYEHISILNKISQLGEPEFWDVKNGPVIRGEKIRREFSHANSFYEIPMNSYSSKLKALRKGNYIVNLNLRSMTIILDTSLKLILKVFLHRDSKGSLVGTHDVQVEPDGQLIVYNNGKSQRNFSSIDLIHPVSLKRTIIYRASLPDTFYSESRGGVQRISKDHILISENTNMDLIHEIDLRSQSKVRTLSFPPGKGKERGDMQQAKLANLTDFLSLNPGL